MEAETFFSSSSEEEEEASGEEEWDGQITQRKGWGGGGTNTEGKEKFDEIFENIFI